MSDQPNIIFIFSDQQRWDSLGCYGQSLPTTPHLDQMAAEGVRFSHAFTPQPLCTPARACIQTGRYATEVGCWMLSMALPTDEPTLARGMRRAGYEAGYIGKWHLASTSERYAHQSKRPGQRQPFDCRTEPVPPERRGGYDDYWLAADCLEHTTHGFDGYLFDGEGRRVDLPEDRFRVDSLTDLALDYLRTRDGQRPFFLYLSYIEPHWQNDESTHPVPEHLVGRFRGYEEPGDLVGCDVPVTWLEHGWRSEYARYLACVHSLDENVGRIRAELGALGMAENTLLVYTSDHGCHFGQRNRGAKDTCHDASLRVPLIACGPGFRSGEVRDEMVSLIDLPPTVLEAGGAPVPELMRGRALQGLADGSRSDWPAEVFYQISPTIIGRGIRTHAWTFSVKAPNTEGWDEPDSTVYVPDCLYDLGADPHQRANLVQEPGLEGRREGLSRTLARRMHEAGEEDFEIALDGRAEMRPNNGG